MHHYQQQQQQQESRQQWRTQTHPQMRTPALLFLLLMLLLTLEATAAGPASSGGGARSQTTTGGAGQRGHLIVPPTTTTPPDAVSRHQRPTLRPLPAARSTVGIESTSDVRHLLAARRRSHSLQPHEFPDSDSDDVKTARQLSGLRQYVISVPTRVDFSGNFVSYDVTQDTHRRRPVAARNRRPRPKRDADTVSNDEPEQQGKGFSSNSDWLFYRLSAFGKVFHFNISINRWLISPSFRTEYWNNSGLLSTVVAAEEQPIDCYYVGYVTQQEVTSRVAISNCRGLTGVFTTDEEEYFVEPLWNASDSGSGHFHVVYKRSDIKAQTNGQCGTAATAAGSFSKTDSNADLQRVLQSRFSEQHISSRWQKRRRRHENRSGTVPQTSRSSHRRSKRSVSRENFVETLVVADRRMVVYHGIDQIQSYILTLMNVVAKLFRDSSIGNDINIVVTRLIILTEDPPDLDITYHADKSLESFCRWQNLINTDNSAENDRRQDVGRHDNAVLITRYDICTYRNQPCGTLGLAPMAGMCEADRSCSIIEDIGIASAFTIAHETGHNFGMQHDGTGNPCGTAGSEPAKIMAAHLAKSSDPFSWSECSRDYITTFLDSGRGSCLENNPWQYQATKLSLQAQTMPLSGKVHSADVQCRYRYGNSSSHCKQDLDICRELWCNDITGHCTSTNLPAADGTLCSVYEDNDSKPKRLGHCYRGLCVRRGWRPKGVAGQWSDWMPWSVCSRTCGGGISFTERHCNRPAPSHGGKYCIGERKRYSSCNIQECPVNSTEFREVQCAKFNNEMFRGKYYKWRPFYTAGNEARTNPCVLNCVAIGYHFYAERAAKVIDGTKCHQHSLDVCINGRCHSVGCDGLLGSSAVEDKCRVCAGNNTNCDTIKGTFDTSLYPPGTNTYVHVTEIPQGATNIHVAECNASRNYLALRSTSQADQYYINGAWTIDWPKQFEIAGTVFTYERPNEGRETLFALGPTTETLMVMLLLQEKNIVIEYEYSTVTNNKQTYEPNEDSLAMRHTKDSSPWSNAAIDTNVRVDKAVKGNTDDGKQGAGAEGTELENESDLTFVGDASTDIIDYDDVIGIDGNSNIDGDSDSSKDEVLTLNVTSRSAAPDIGEDSEPVVGSESGAAADMYEWIYLPWSECSVTCGRGVSQSTGVCASKSNHSIVSNDKCAHLPFTSRSVFCNELPCPPEWRVSAWSACSKSCSRGHRSRHVVCVQRAEADRDFDIVTDDACPSPKPKTRTKCTGNKCAPKWTAGEWTECWPPCGDNATRSRVVQCTGVDGTVLEEKRCSGIHQPRLVHNEPCDQLQPCPPSVWVTGAWTSQPVSSSAPRLVHNEPCDQLQPCPPSVWVTGAWTSCSVSCGMGEQMRLVGCRTSFGEPSTTCDKKSMPPNVRPCEVTCTHHDLSYLAAEDCQDVDAATYCPIVLKFQFCSRPYFRQICCQTCASHRTTPAPERSLGSASMFAGQASKPGHVSTLNR